MTAARGAAVRGLWMLDPEVAFLNHGSFGACPRRVFDFATEMRARLEREPIRFLIADLDRKMDEARAAIAAFMGADEGDLAFVPNATAGTSTVVRSLKLAPGDELVTTDHAYNACRQQLEEAALLAGARVVTAVLPFPTPGPEAVVDAILAAVTPRTRLVMIDHITSPSALVMPVKEIVAALAARGVDALVDAAHAPGMVPLRLDDTGAAYTTGNFHKWLCAPKVAAFLHVRRDRHDVVRPLAVSHGRNSPRTDRTRFRLEHDWTGTFDPAPFLALPELLRFFEETFEGGVAGWMSDNHEAALAARRTLASALGAELLCPNAMIGSMAAVLLPADLPGHGERWAADALSFDPLQTVLYERYRIEVPIVTFPKPPSRLVRVSTPAYVSDDHVARLAAALVELRSRRG
jgi:isopenicillin-N epimerase